MMDVLHFIVNAVGWMVLGAVGTYVAAVVLFGAVALAIVSREWFREKRKAWQRKKRGWVEFDGGTAEELRRLRGEAIRCHLDEVQEGHVYRFILRGCWKGICTVDSVQSTGVLAVSVVSPSYRMWERFARNKFPTWKEGRVMRFDINWFRDVTGFSEVTE